MTSIGFTAGSRPRGTDAGKAGIGGDRCRLAQRNDGGVGVGVSHEDGDRAQPAAVGNALMST